MTCLPNELLFQVFSALDDPNDLKTCRLICRGWSATAGSLFFRSLHASILQPLPRVLEQDCLRQHYQCAQTLVFDTSSVLDTIDIVYWYTKRIQRIALRQAAAREAQGSRHLLSLEKWVNRIKRRFPLNGTETKHLWSSFDKQFIQERSCDWSQSQWTENLQRIFHLCPKISSLTIKADPYVDRSSFDWRTEFQQIGSMDDRQYNLGTHWTTVLRLLEGLDGISHVVKSLVLLNADWFWFDLRDGQAAVYRTMSRLTTLELGFEERTSMSISGGIKLADFIASATRLRKLKVKGHAEYPDFDPVLQQLHLTSRVAIDLCNLQFSEDAFVAFFESNRDSIERVEIRDVAMTSGSWASTARRITVSLYECSYSDFAGSMCVICGQVTMLVDAVIRQGYAGVSRFASDSDKSLDSVLTEDDLYLTCCKSIQCRSVRGLSSTDWSYVLETSLV